MLKKEYHVLLPFIAAPWRGYTFKEIKESSKKTSNSYVFSILKKCVKEGILREESVGNVVRYRLHLDGLKAQVSAGSVAEHLAWTRQSLPYPTLQKVADKIPTPFFTFIITGSYAKGTQKKTSDIDVVVVIDDAEEPRRVYAQLRSVCEMSVPEVHLYVFKESEFLAMLADKKANYGKEIVKNNLLLCGAQAYYRMMAEAIAHGFDDKNLS